MTHWVRIRDMRQTYRRAFLRNRAITNLPSVVPHWESARGLNPNADQKSKKNREPSVVLQTSVHLSLNAKCLTRATELTLSTKKKHTSPKWYSGGACLFCTFFQKNCAPLAVPSFLRVCAAVLSPDLASRAYRIGRILASTSIPTNLSP